MDKLLLHVCCGPCATASVIELSKKYHLTGFFYNPNIHPYSEYRRRFIYARRFFSERQIPLLTEAYQPEDYFLAIEGSFTTPQRCWHCYQLRLEKTAQKGVAEKIKTISTTLLISPYQDHEQLKKIGFAIAAKWGLNFYYQDLRPLFRLSRQMAKEAELYLQKYCGCLFSEKERQTKPNQKKRSLNYSHERL